MTPPLASLNSRSRRPQGILLLELLMYMLLAAGVTAAVSKVLISLIRTDSNMEMQQRAIDLWNRINYLIESEVAEGNEILYGQPVPGACGGGTSLFTVRVPVQAEGPDPGAGRMLSIHYYLEPMQEAGQNRLMRCGPPFHANGRLDVAATAGARDALPALVGQRVILELQPNDDDRRSVHYHLNISSPALWVSSGPPSGPDDPGHQENVPIFRTPRSTIARTRVSEVPIPPPPSPSP